MKYGSLFKSTVSNASAAKRDRRSTFACVPDATPALPGFEPQSRSMCARTNNRLSSAKSDPRGLNIRDLVDAAGVSVCWRRVASPSAASIYLAVTSSRLGVHCCFPLTYPSAYGIVD